MTGMLKWEIDFKREFCVAIQPIAIVGLCSAPCSTQYLFVSVHLLLAVSVTYK